MIISYAKHVHSASNFRGYVYVYNMLTYSSCLNVNHGILNIQV